MTFKSKLDTATFDKQLKEPITNALLSILEQVNLTSSDVELKVKEDKTASVIFSKIMNKEEAEKLIDDIKNPDFIEKFNEKKIKDAKLDFVSNYEKSK